MAVRMIVPSQEIEIIASILWNRRPARARFWDQALRYEREDILDEAHAMSEQTLRALLHIPDATIRKALTGAGKEYVHLDVAETQARIYAFVNGELTRRYTETVNDVVSGHPPEYYDDDDEEG